MSAAPSPPVQPLDPKEPDDRAFRRLLLFQFCVLSGLFALGVPGLFVSGEAQTLHPLYYMALAIHLFFLWRLYRFDPGMRPFIEGFLLVVVALPWCCYALEALFGLAWYLTGPVLFTLFVLLVIWRTSRGADARA